jgi:hypothetical protein
MDEQKDLTLTLKGKFLKITSLLISPVRGDTVEVEIIVLTKFLSLCLVIVLR